MGHSRYECWWEEEGGLAFLEFRKETEDFCPTSAPGTGSTKADAMLLLPSAWAHEKGCPQRQGTQSYGTAQSESSVG